jgi:hypothetical protein
VLYKLHGSINWKRGSETKELFCVRQTESVHADRMEVIFGREFKLEADPYLFFAYRFRALSMAARLMAVLGYGFGDAHINKMLTQSLRSDSERRLLIIQRCEEEDCDGKAKEIVKLLDLGDDRATQIKVHSGSAKQFLGTSDLAEYLVNLLPASKDAPF